VSVIDLFLIGDSESFQAWSMGEVVFCSSNPAALSSMIQKHLLKTNADALLFWDASFPLPPKDLVEQLLSSTSEVWHAGLKLGLSGKPEIIDYVSPTWMLNRDPDSSIEATSWRLSLRACLIRSGVLRQLGGPRAEYDSLDVAGLDLGLRYIRQGAFVRHVPALIQEQQQVPDLKIPLSDELLFIRYGFGRRWVRWAFLRAALTRFARLGELYKAWCKVSAQKVHQYPSFYRQHFLPENDSVTGKVSVLVPTLKRYPYLRVLLDQLRRQIIPPFEVLVIDQTPEDQRESGLQNEFSDLPLRWFFLDTPGQCSSRNFGLLQAQGDFILFVDDDDEIQPDLIEKHLETLARFQTTITNGVAIEPAIGDLPKGFSFVRISNVFPTNNTLIRKDVLHKSGLFDLAYDHGQRADHDLGMRLYLQGELMVLNPDVKVVHHHAPMGGLREHKARVNTYAASRTQLFKQELPSVSDLYLSKRYFSDRQVRERLWIDLIGTFSVKGSILKRFLKVLIAILLLPKNIHLLRQRTKTAERMLVIYPEIPQLQQEDS